MTSFSICIPARSTESSSGTLTPPCSLIAEEVWEDGRKGRGKNGRKEGSWQLTSHTHDPRHEQETGTALNASAALQSRSSCRSTTVRGATRSAVHQAERASAAAAAPHWRGADPVADRRVPHSRTGSGCTQSTHPACTGSTGIARADKWEKQKRTR